MILGYKQRLKNLGITIHLTLIISQDCYELPKRNIRANGNIYHIFKPNIFRDLQKPYQNKTSIHMIVDEFKYLTGSCWDKKNTTTH